MRPVIACHCTQCRKWSGHFVAATSVPLDRFRLTRDSGLRWHSASIAAKRGFCRHCGSSLFWQPVDEARISICAGAFDGPTGLSIEKHIFTEEAGDYYSPEGAPPVPDSSPVPDLTASCLCQGVHFTLPAPAGPVTACHCSQCRKTSGHYAASFDIAAAPDISASRTPIGTYTTPGGADRTFCANCGTTLWFRDRDGSYSVEAGIIDGATGSRLASHIFVSAKGDYYQIDDGLPQSPLG